MREAFFALGIVVAVAVFFGGGLIALGETVVYLQHMNCVWGWSHC